MTKKLTPAQLRARKRKNDASEKRLHGECMYEMLALVQDWSERNRQPFRSVMIGILGTWMRRMKFKDIPAPSDFMDEVEGKRKRA